jgi:hypothetical protein
VGNPNDSTRETSSFIPISALPIHELSNTYSKNKVPIMITTPRITKEPNVLIISGRVTPAIPRTPPVTEVQDFNKASNARILTNVKTVKLSCESFKYMIEKSIPERKTKRSAIITERENPAPCFCEIVRAYAPRAYETGNPRKKIFPTEMVK